MLYNPDMHTALFKNAARLAGALLAAAACGACFGSCPDPPPPEGVVSYGYRIVNVYPHDDGAFTQGLTFHEGALFEGTGQYGRSTLREVELETGRVLRNRPLGASLFGEGICVVGDVIVQLTWKAGMAFVYERDTFKRIGEFKYEGEGWGLTHDGTHYIMSNGTAALRVLDSETFDVVRTIHVRLDGAVQSNLNELEYINGAICANVWQEEHILRIDPETGAVIAVIDLEGLLETQGDSASAGVLNGIAYDNAADRLFVTGKSWPWLFEIELVEQPARGV